MASPAPAWRVKTRPCPFYQQGRCYFEDSCNFVHNVSVKASPDPIFVPVPSKAISSNPPAITVQSPQSIRSSVRSPRMSDLLFALRDVIGDEPGDTSNESAPVNDLNAPEGSEDSKFIDSISLRSNKGETTIEDSRSPSADVANTALANDSLCVPPASRSSSPDTEHSPVCPVEPADPSDLLSPVNLSHLNLNAFAYVDYDFSAKDGDSIDSGYADTWNAPQPFANSPPRSPSSSTIDLFSPLGASSHQVLSPQLSAFVSRPPDSPFGSFSAPEGLSNPSLASPEKEPDGNVTVDNSPSSTLDVLEATGKLVGDGDTGSDPGEGPSEDTRIGPTSKWDLSEGQATVVYLGMPPLTPKEVSDAIIHSSTTPTRFLAEAINFVDDEANSSFSAVSRSPSPTPSRDRDGESVNVPLLSSDEVGAGIDREQNLSDAKLAYLASPAIPANENDSLDSIYDGYSATSVLSTNTDGIPSIGTAEESLSAKTPVRRELIRERVFTPPLVHGERSGVVSAGSPVSPPSPRIFSDAASLECASHSRDTRSMWSPDSLLPGVEKFPVSKKIPFGFRRSRPVDHTKSSSLNSNPHRPPALASNRISSSQSDRAFSPDTSSPVASGLRPLKLSSILGPVPSSAPGNFSFTDNHQPGNINRLSMSSTTVSSESSISRNPLVSSAHPSLIPKHIRNTLFASQDIPPSSSSYQSRPLSKLDEPHSSPLPDSSSWQFPSITQISRNNYRPASKFSEPSFGPEDEDEGNDEDTDYDHTIRRPLSIVPHTAPISRTASVTHPPMYAIATPPPMLMFAIASDDVDQVRQVLENGGAGPNDPVGPQSALAFALTNDQLTHKMDIVKTLLAYGADPAVLKKESLILPSRGHDDGITMPPPSNSLVDAMDPATRYYVQRADAPHTRRTSALIHRSFFRPLTRVQYELIGQDRALEQLFRVLSIHSRQLSVTPIVVLLCGPSGHGKSLLARKFGSLLDVPTHTVNMTVLNSTQDLWQSYSMSPYETPTTCTLAEFLINNEGKRCVVVLDEIEKTHDEKTLWSLLMPWELGRCAFEANGRHIDVRNVVWLGTSNVGHGLVFEHHEARAQPDEIMSKEEYVELMGLLRPRVSERLGASILSRVTTVLPFVPFTLEEKRAICFEALHNIAEEAIRTLSPAVVDSMVDGALASYTSAEGARSLYRAVSNQLIDNI